MDELAAKRKERQARASYVDVGTHLRQVSHLFDKRRLVDQPYAAVVVLISENGPEVTWAGSPTPDDLYLAADAVKTAWAALARNNDPHEAVREMVQRVRRYERAQAERIADYERTHPFKCSHPNCRDRFKSKAALTRHERHDCHWFKYEREKAST